MSRLDELSSITFEGSLGQCFTAYGRKLEELADYWSTELAMAAVDAEAAMAAMKGHWYLLGLDSKVKARRVAKRLKRAQELADALAEQGDRFPRAYRKNFHR